MDPRGLLQRTRDKGPSPFPVRQAASIKGAMSSSDRGPTKLALFTQHSRHWRENRYVYPVISRRSKGLSIGVNLNPDTVCNFDCVYCCVDRTATPMVREVDLDLLAEEL